MLKGLLVAACCAMPVGSAIAGSNMDDVWSNIALGWYDAAASGLAAKCKNVTSEDCERAASALADARKKDPDRFARGRAMFALSLMLTARAEVADKVVVDALGDCRVAAQDATICDRAEAAVYAAFVARAAGAGAEGR